MELPKPVLFSFDYPPLDGGISRLCSEIVGQASAYENVEFKVVSGTSRRPWRELKALASLMRFSAAPYCLCGLWYPEGLIATLVGSRKRIILAHGSELMPTRQRWRRAIWNLLQRWVMTKAQVVVANSQYTAELVRSVSPGAKVIAIPLAVDPEKFSPGPMPVAREKMKLPQDKFILCSVSRVHKYKGFETVFQAIASLSPGDREQLLYVIAGNGPDRKALEAMTRELGIEKNVQWMGFVADSDLADVYRAADLFVLCTRENKNSREVEGFGLVFLEAQACGTPAIGTRAGGIPDAISDGNGGWLITPDSAEELAKHILRLKNDNQEMSQQRVRARTRVVESCTWKKYVRHLFSELEAMGVINA